MVFAIGVAFLFFREVPDLWTMIGVAIVIGAGTTPGGELKATGGAAITGEPVRVITMQVGDMVHRICRGQLKLKMYVADLFDFGNRYVTLVLANCSQNSCGKNR